MPPEGRHGERIGENSWETLGADADALRKAMGHYPTGVTVVTSGRGERAEGMTANAVMSVSLDPLLFLVSVHKDARLNGRISHLAQKGTFKPKELADLVARLSGRDTDRPARS